VFKFNNINIRRKDKPFYSYFQIFLVEFEFIPHAPGACPHGYFPTAISAIWNFFLYFQIIGRKSDNVT